MKDTIDQTLSRLRKGQQVTVIYNGSLEQAQFRVSGSVTNIDSYWSILQIENIAIDFSEICEVYT